MTTFADRLKATVHQTLKRGRFTPGPTICDERLTLQFLPTLASNAVLVSGYCKTVFLVGAEGWIPFTPQKFIELSDVTSALAGAIKFTGVVSAHMEKPVPAKQLKRAHTLMLSRTGKARAKLEDLARALREVDRPPWRVPRLADMQVTRVRGLMAEIK